MAAVAGDGHGSTVCELAQQLPSQCGFPQPQIGAESCYGRRRPEDSRMDPARPLQEQFPLLQVVDNEAYPAFFEWKGRRFRIRVEPWQ